ncbi:hypothetical protein [Klebsiella quasipneumoniae]|uniref:hypothetical protein n=1 Tax=Klebsiella quasipneumoniae TaxID=1463165 RepID=UPI00388FDFB4
MSMKLHLGVEDIPYESESVTTGDVAEFLEDKYGIMAHFFWLYGPIIAELMAESIAGQLENIIADPRLPGPFRRSDEQSS